MIWLRVEVSRALRRVRRWFTSIETWIGKAVGAGAVDEGAVSPTGSRTGVSPMTTLEEESRDWRGD